VARRVNKVKDIGARYLVDVDSGHRLR